MIKSVVPLFIFLCVGIHAYGTGLHSLYNDGDPPNVRIEKDVFHDAVVYRYYSDKASPDSVKSYYRGTETLQYISYDGRWDPVAKTYSYPSDTIYRAYYRNGTPKHMRFYRETPMAGDTSAVYFYDDGTIRHLDTFVKDSLDYPQLWTSFHPGGTLYREGIMDHYKVWLVPHGIWYEYDKNGTLVQAVLYHNDEPHLAYLIEREYDPGGAVVSEKIFNNYVLAEDDPVELGAIPLGKQVITQAGICDSLRRFIKKDIYGDANYRDTGAEPPSYCRHLRHDLIYFLKVMLVADNRIDSIMIDKNTVTIWGDYGKGFIREGGYKNIYNQFHDIYSSLFSFTAVDAVRVFDCMDECRNTTFLPLATDEPLIRMEGAVMLRKWYLPGVDYYYLVGEDKWGDERYFNGRGELRGEALDSIIEGYE